MRQVDKRRGKIHSGQDAISVAQHVLSEDLHPPRSRQQEPEQDRESRRLPGPVAAEQRRGDATRDGKTDAVNRDGGRITLDEIVDFDGGRGHRPYMTRYRDFGQYGPASPNSDRTRPNLKRSSGDR